MTTDEQDSERGSVLLLGIGLLAVCLLTLAVVIDVGALLAQRQALLAVADGASLAGAQGIDMEAYYDTGATVGTRLEPGAVREAVLAYVRLRPGDAGIRLESVATDGETVRVEVSGPMRVPFLRAVIGERIHVRSAARLDFAPQ